jgi:hypothetical protein
LTQLGVKLTLLKYFTSKGKVMKKKIATICAGLLTTLLFVGCGSTKDNLCCDSEQKSNLTKQPEGIKIEPKLEPKSIKPQPPVIVLKDDLFKIKACKTVDIDATGSYDPDSNGDHNLSYLWTDIDGKKVSDKPSFTRYYDHRHVDELTLRVTDEQNLTTIDRVCVLVGIDDSEIPLIARVDGKLDITSGKKTDLEARAVCKDSDEIKRYEWKEANTILSNKATLKRVFPTGNHVLTLTIEEITGDIVTSQVIVNVK